MQFNEASLNALNAGFQTIFQTGFAGVEPQWSKIATKITSTAKLETYGWLKDFPKMREWIGERIRKQLGEKAYQLFNRKFEMTVTVKRDDIEDDTLGIYNPLMAEMGRAAASHPDELIFIDTVGKAFDALCFDGQPFFDTDHPVGKEGAEQSVSNVQAGAGNPWFLMDTSRALKPFIYQERKKARMVVADDPKSPNVFNRDEIDYGVDSREAGGFGFWQTAFASEGELTPENFDAARTAMRRFKDDEGRPLGIRPKLLMVGASNEGRARRLLEAEMINNETNIWRNTAELFVCDWLD